MIPHCIASKAVLLTATFMWFVLTPAHDSAAWDNTGDLRQVTPHRKTDETILRVLSYNIHHAAGTDGKLDLTRIANVINSVKPDVVSLQEVDQNGDDEVDEHLVTQGFQRVPRTEAVKHVLAALVRGAVAL